MFSFNKNNYLSLLIIILQIILIKSDQPNDIKNTLSNKISDYNAGSGPDISIQGGYTYTEDEFGIQISFIEKQSYTDSQNIKFPQIILTDDCKNKIIEKLKPEALIVTKVFTTFSFDSSTKNNKVGITKISDVLYYELRTLKIIK